ncbi:hypothetical protein FOA19_11205 [Rufibacter hautae]|uniref:Uncharacterized protein n=1 Tax=Rufibacter hautae TaxID=2595005 RepID=A0A5B6TBI7_9BACT|nr:hypothetical protein FOA19_11205 [Rufibacter hautae]
MKTSKQITDSLRNSGIDSIIIYNHYSRIGYSKILWNSGNAVYQILIVEKMQEHGIKKKTGEIQISGSRKQFRLLNISTLQSVVVLKDCGGFVAPMPYHLLYLHINGQESCLTVAEDQLECNTENKKVKLIKELKMLPDEYFALAFSRD